MSSLPYEFTVLYDMLVQRLSHQDAQQWLKDRAENAANSSFLTAQTPIGPNHLVLDEKSMNWLFCYQPSFS